MQSQRKLRHGRNHRISPGALLLAGAGVLAGCTPADGESVRLGALNSPVLGDPFVAIPRAGDPSSLYLAVHRSELGRPWFLDAALTQASPADVIGGVPRLLGTRMVELRADGTRVYVTTVSASGSSENRGEAGAVVDSYPVVTGYRPFETLPRAGEYVLVDVAGASSRIHVADGLPDLDVAASPPPTTTAVAIPAFMKNARKAKTAEAFLFDLWFKTTAPSQDHYVTTLRLRRSAEGSSLPPSNPHSAYFFTGDRYDPSAGAHPLRWSLPAGREPIRFYISRAVLRAQADHPDLDVIGAVRRGIEGWNAALGYPAFSAEIAPEGSNLLAPEANLVTFDYPGAASDPAFANWSVDVRTGEIVGATINIGGGWTSLLGGAPSPRDPLAPPLPKPARPTPQWDGMGREQSAPACIYWPPAYDPPYSASHLSIVGPEPEPLDPRWEIDTVEHVITHEMGHVLGLRHNFAGSLVSPSSSVMDLLRADDRARMPTPGVYDVQAVRHLYLAGTPPSLPFCTDGEVGTAPDCQRYDHGVDPLVLPNTGP
jgi:hypothetical protein